MEIKVFCPCGAKFKFDVEPVNERMPWPVACPVCNRDGTADANEIIRQTLATAPPSIPTVQPAPVPVPVASASAPAPAPAGLRVNRPAAAPAPAPGAPAAAPAPLPTAAPTRLSAARPKSVTRGESPWKKALTAVLVVLVIGAFVFKWYLRIRRIARVTNAISAAADDSPSSDRTWNLQADNSVVLLIQHTNNQQVVTECLAFWKDKYHQTYNVIKPGSPGDEEGEFMVNAPFHGYVVLTGLRDWSETEFEATAARLSEKFGGMVFLERDLSFSGDFIFGVYDHGTNVFHARADTNFKSKDMSQVTKVEHEDWALAHGYKRGSNGSNEFNVGDADDITKACGVRIWNAPAEVRDDLILKNTKSRPAG